MDCIALRVKKVIDTQYWSDEKILEELLKKVEELKG